MLPGVININDELRLNGGTVSKIYINGRELHDRTELSSLQATEIENVEILPEADLQHNATTKGGIIYILLKKNADRKSTRLNSSHDRQYRMPSSA